MFALFAFWSAFVMPSGVAEAHYTLEYVKSWESGPNQYDLAVAPDGNVYVVDINDDDVRYFDPDGEELGRWALPQTPVGIAIDREGIVHIAGDGVVRRYTATGTYLSSISVASPTVGVALDRHGNLYTGSFGPGVSDTAAGVRKYDSNGRYLLRMDAPDPKLVHVDEDGDVYVTNGREHFEASNSALKVQKFSAAGKLLEETLDGGDCGDFNILWGITGDGYGNVLAVNVRWPIPKDVPNLMLLSDSLSCVEKWHLAPPPGDPDAGVFLDIAIDGAGNVYIADTYYHRILKYRYDKIEPPAPPTFSLASPRPNPSSENVSFEFSTQVEGPASLEVFDAVGRRVNSWRWTMLPAGPHVVVWNGRDERGRNIPSGPVFYRLTSNGAHLTNRLIRLR